MNTDFRGQTCGIYPRVSTKRQAKEDKTSIKDQIVACRYYADMRDMEVDEDCVEPDAYTSMRRSRPGFNKLLATMKAHRVQNLIIDTADRMTREGMIVAADFLGQFIEAGIMLHVVSMDLIVNDDKGVKAFMDAAYYAQQDNKLRTRKALRSKRSRASKGIFNRGNHAPYGYHYVPVAHDESGNVTDKRIERDERTYGERGFVTDFAPTPYATRCEIIRLYTDQSWSFQKIANKLNDAHVPTSAALLKRTHGQGIWYARTINYLISQPINEGRMVNRFAETEESPAQVIDVESKYGNPAALVDDHSLAVIAKRRERNLETYYPRTSMSGGSCAAGGTVGQVRRMWRYNHCYGV